MTLPLLMPCPNDGGLSVYRRSRTSGAGAMGASGAGDTDLGLGPKKMFVLNPAATSAEHKSMFRFLGQLIGISAISQLYFEIDLAPVAWKLIVEELVTLADIEQIDSSYKNKLDPGYLEAEPDQAFTFTSALTGEEVELHPGGAAELLGGSADAVSLPSTPWSQKPFTYPHTHSLSHLSTEVLAHIYQP